MDDDTIMEGPGNENGGEIARPEPDAAVARREAATMAVAAMSRRVNGLWRRTREGFEEGRAGKGRAWIGGVHPLV